MTTDWTPKYLHQVSDRVKWLDRRVCGEIAATLAAMMSRVPRGGISARYRQLVEATAREMQPSWEQSTNADIRVLFQQAEERLTTYPLPLCIHNPAFDTSTYDRASKTDANGNKPGFMDLNVALYGHGSIKELTGYPVVFIEGISWWFAFLSFWNPLVKGQEMSTRAVWRGLEWDVATDMMSLVQDGGAQIFGLPERLSLVHKLGLQMAYHELQAWKVELRKPCPFCHGTLLVGDEDDKVDCEWCNGTGKKYPWMNDPQAFRPAFDRARAWLPGTISTGIAHAADIRTMGRVLQVIRDLATVSGQRAVLDLLEEVEEAYRQALPGMAGMWLREALHDDAAVESPTEDQNTDELLADSVHPMQRSHERQLEESRARLPGGIHFPASPDRYSEDSRDVYVRITQRRSAVELRRANVKKRTSRRQYADPFFNAFASAEVDWRGSLAASRDWNRHRGFQPWQFRVVRNNNAVKLGADEPVWGPLQIDHHYEPISEFGRANVDRYLALCTEVHDACMAEGNQWLAMAALPFGTRVHLSSGGGLQHATYMTELRGYVAGGNFEYQEQAREMLLKLELEVARLRSGALNALAYDQNPATD